jgi:hypothetical protein
MAVAMLAAWWTSAPAQTPPGASTVLPAGAPDRANPFVVDDAKKLPVPLPPPAGGPQKLDCDIHIIDFDGVTSLEMTFIGPDFEWDVEPLTEWSRAPAGAGETVAFVSNDNPLVRLSFTLYKPHDLLPALDATSVIRYLAAIRQTNPKAFVLMSAIAPGDDQVNSMNFHSCDSERVDYYFKPASGKLKDVIEHNDYFIDLHGYYMLVMRLSGPPGWLEQLRPALEFHLRRSARKKGLGLGETPAETSPTAPAAPAAPPAAPTPAAAGDAAPAAKD